MRIAYMGTPAFAVPALRAIHAAGHDIVAVYTQPPRPAKRGKKLQPSPVHEAAEVLRLPVRTPVNFKDDADRAAFAALDLDCAVVAAYGLILPRALLDAPRHGCVNLHASRLPRWRGAAPIHRAILAGDAITGMTLMQMDVGLDTGPMIACRDVAIDRKTTGELTDELAELGATMIVDALPLLASLPRTPQPDSGVTYAAKIDKAESRLDFTQPAAALERAVRAFNPAPGAWFALGDERIKVLAADIVPDTVGAPPGAVLDDRLTIACGEQALRPVLVQRAGRGAMAVHDLLRGLPVTPGTRLS